MSRPNFLFIITDQQRADHLGCYGNRTLKTPALDAIARGGVAFDRHYVASAVCMPNRATLVTGRMPSLHGVRHNGIELPLESVTLPELLRAAGYRTALVGKAHLQNVTNVAALYGREEPREGHAAPPGALAEARAATGRGTPSGYGQERSELWLEDSHRMQLPYYGFDSVDLSARHGDRTGADYLVWAKQRDANIEKLRGRDNALPAPGYKTHEGWRTRVPEELYSTSYVAERTMARLEEFAKIPGQPFFLWSSFPDPHHPWTPPGKYWDMYKPEDMALDPAYWAERKDLPRHLAWYYEQRDSGKTSDATAGVPAVYAADQREVQEAMALTYGMLSMIDDAVGRITATLKRLGLDRNTVIVFTSDHGDYMGDHQLLLKSQLHYQGLIRTPFIWADPEQSAQAGTHRSAITGAIDFTRTVLDRAAVAPANGMQGMALTGVAADPQAGTREALLIEEEAHRFPGWLGLRARIRTVLTTRHRLSVYQGTGWGELYDLQEDPRELHNLWDEQGSTRLRAELTETLARLMMENDDKSPAPVKFA